MAEFAYNNSQEKATKKTAFYTNYWYHAVYEAIGHMIPQEQQDMSQLHDKVRENVTVAQLCHKENYDQMENPIQIWNQETKYG